MLVLHGTRHDLVPVSLSEQFVGLVEIPVTYEQFEEAHHTGSWNVDRDCYEAAMVQFLSDGLSAVAVPQHVRLPRSRSARILCPRTTARARERVQTSRE
jgi:hypothetical protein